MMKKSSDKWVFPFINKQLAIEHGPIEIVDLPSYIAWWIFPVRYGRVYQAWVFPIDGNLQADGAPDGRSFLEKWSLGP